MCISTSLRTAITRGGFSDSFWRGRIHTYCLLTGVSCLPSRQCPLGGDPLGGDPGDPLGEVPAAPKSRYWQPRR